MREISKARSLRPISCQVIRPKAGHLRNLWLYWLIFSPYRSTATFIGPNLQLLPGFSHIFNKPPSQLWSKRSHTNLYSTLWSDKIPLLMLLRIPKSPQSGSWKLYIWIPFPYWLMTTTSTLPWMMHNYSRNGLLRGLWRLILHT